MDKSIPIVVIAYNRPKALERLLSSLLKADYPGEVELIISVDGGGDQQVKTLANDFQWPFGEKKLIYHESNQGLRNHVLSCGDISRDYDGVIVLEDDLFVSPDFYRYTLDAYSFYKDDPKIAGISLYSHSYNETAQFPFVPLDDGTDAFFFQYASSWGQFWPRKAWEDFRQWYDGVENRIVSKELLPENIRLWPENSWKKFFIEYLIRNDLYFVYPRKSLTTIFGDEGTNIRFRETFLQVPLWEGKRSFTFRGFEESTAVYDTWCEILLDRLRKMCDNLPDIDFAVDLYGMKTLKEITNPYILTTRRCRNPIMTFGREMIPQEANVIHNIPGKEIKLGKITDFDDQGYFFKLLKVHEKKELAYRYPIREYHFGKKKLIVTNRSDNKMTDPAFLFKKTISTAKYAWKYFFGK